MKSSTLCQISYAQKITIFLSQHRAKKMARRRPKTNSEGGRNPFPQTPRLPSALSERRARARRNQKRNYGARFSEKKVRTLTKKQHNFSKNFYAPPDFFRSTKNEMDHSHLNINVI